MAYNYEYPGVNMNDYNNDWLINKVKELACEWINVQKDWADLKEYVDTYFKKLDLNEEISNKLDEMYKDGTFNNIVIPILLQHLPPLLVDSVEDMSDVYRLYILKENAHIYQYMHVWTDTGVVFGSSIGNVFTYAGVLPNNGDYNTYTTPNQVWISSAPNNHQNAPYSGESGYLTIYGTSGNYVQEFMKFEDGSRYWRYALNNVWSEWNEIGANSFTYAGVLPNNGDYNTYTTPNRVWISSAPNNHQNAPYSGESGYLTIYGTSGNYVQEFMKFEDGSRYWRYALNNVWSKWVNTQFRSNGTLRSMCNSLLNGTVWNATETGHTSYNATYGNAPYSVIASAIGIDRRNVNHTLSSDTGIVYSPSGNSFLSQIMNTDFSSYDVLLTHFALPDMRTQLGDVNSDENSNTLVGAVKKILNHLRTSNGMCQLILVSIPPATNNPNITGEDTFTHKWENASSIGELDVVMHQLAKTKHFTYIDWQELNLSYYYIDYVDNSHGNYTHPNNEVTYRLMGAYLGARASEQIHF